ncbi:hypothetical protein D3C86_2171040 [compost metagenome]
MITLSSVKPEPVVTVLEILLKPRYWKMISWVPAGSVNSYSPSSLAMVPLLVPFTAIPA